MKKSTLFIMCLICVAVAFTGCSKEKASADAPVLVVYATDSFLSDWGPAPVVFPLFEEKYGIKIEKMPGGNAGEIVNLAIMEKEKPSADVIIGVDNNILSTVLKNDLFTPYKPAGIEKINSDLIFDKSHHVTPYNYSFFSLVYDSEKIKNPPKCLDDLLDPKYKKSLIVMDPRTSSPGLGFLMWTIKCKGEGFKDYWKNLMPNVLTVSESWSSGYGLFTSGEAPMVISYTTSPAYHVEYEKDDHIKTVLFEEGNYMQIEGVGILKNAPHMDAAKKFLDFILTEDFQEVLPLTNWMYPVTDIQLPASYISAPISEKPLLLDHDDIDKNLDSWLAGWLESTLNK
ncbi:MAG: thiamine ABC transporter substrate-binding protein [Spirochaetia bacterium]|nr:thiamine ABC transporter substrate-binding protein [Spirochaetia bacterium]